MWRQGPTPSHEWRRPPVGRRFDPPGHRYPLKVRCWSPTPCFSPDPGRRRQLLRVTERQGTSWMPHESLLNFSGSRDAPRRHLSSANEWFPHEYVPWGRGQYANGDASWGDDPLLDPAARVRADRQFVDRGQSSSVLCRAQQARQRRCLGRVGAPLDRRRRPAFDRDP